MALLTEQQKDFFSNNGYLVVPRNVPYKDLEEARMASDRILDKCIKIRYPFARADQRISDTFIEKLDHVFHPDIFEPEIFKVVMASNILEYSKELLGDEIFMSFNRMHTTRKYSTWSSWHRDDTPTGKQIVIKATLPLYNEVGFTVIPRSHKMGNKDIEGDDTNTRAPMKDQKILPVKAGDLLLFDTAIVHRGACAGREKYKRAHIHFRFGLQKYANELMKTRDDFFTKKHLLEMANESWQKILTQPYETDQYYTTTQKNDPATMGKKINQQFVKLAYYFSSILPQKSRWISEPNPNFLPYIKVPKEYEDYFVY